MCASNSDSSFVIKRSRFVFSTSFAVGHSPPFPSRPLSKMRHFRKPKMSFLSFCARHEHRCLSTKDFAYFKILHSPSIAKGSENVMRRREGRFFLLAFFLRERTVSLPKGFFALFRQITCAAECDNKRADTLEQRKYIFLRTTCYFPSTVQVHNARAHNN